MTPLSCARMAEYNHWMNLRLYDASAKLNEQQLVEERGAFFGSLFGTLNHIAVADTIWLRRFAQHPDLTGIKHKMAGFPSPSSLRQRLAPSLDELREYRMRLDQVIVEFAGVTTEVQLASTLRYATTTGEAPIPLI